MSQSKDFVRDEERHKQGEAEKEKREEKGGKRVMERQEQTLRADGEQAS